MEKIDTKGTMPGWIYRHRAVLLSTEEIRISGGIVVSIGSDNEVHVDNDSAFVLNIRTLEWRKAD
jgi:hypothetical protein